MTKRYFKNLKIIGRFFCIYNTKKTGMLPVYKYEGLTYCKPRKPAENVTKINGVGNLIMCQPMQIGVITGYKEVA